MTAIVTLNAGSSSIKFAVFLSRDKTLEEIPKISGQIADLEGRPTFHACEVGRVDSGEEFAPEGIRDHDTAWAFLVGWLEEALNGEPPALVAHRIVHGGVDFAGPSRLTELVIEKLEALSALAPGHQPHNLAGVAAAAKHWPKAAQIGCFDTAFHRTLSRAEQIYALPRALTEEGFLRYGFHGLNYDYVAGAADAVMGDYAHDKMIVAHLGAGASMCAIENGRSVATTMGFTALDGLPMATRSGAIDPGLVLHLLESGRMSAGEAAACLYSQSGLLGISGISGDMRVLEASANPAAALAIDYFTRRINQAIGALAAAMGGVDALVFTGGVGENSALIRRRVIEGAAWLGFALDEAANDANARRITKEGATPSAWVLRANEELTMARQAHSLASEDV